VRIRNITNKGTLGPNLPSSECFYTKPFDTDLYWCRHLLSAFVTFRFRQLYRAILHTARITLSQDVYRYRVVIDTPSNFQHRLATHSSFSIPKRYCNMLTGTSLMWAMNAWGIKNRDFRPISHFISEMIRDRAIVIM